MNHKRFKTVEFNNKKKQIRCAYTSGKTIILHYKQLGINKPIRKAWIDKDTSGQSIGFYFLDGSTNYMPYDQPLAIMGDSDFLLQNQIELLIAKIKKTIYEKKISKRYLANQLGTSDNQIQRLLNPAILNKNLPQLYHLAHLLGLDVEIRLKAA